MSTFWVYVWVDNENVCVEISELSNAANAIGSNETVADQASNTPGNFVDHLTASSIDDVNSEVDTEIKQGPQVDGNQPSVHSRHQSSTDEDLLPKQAQDVEKKFHHYCCICTEYVYVLVNGCHQIAAHEACLDKYDLNHTDWNCFQRDRTVKWNDYPAASTSASYGPSSYDDNKRLSLVCDLCKKDVVIMKLLCCNGEYHEDCLNQYKEQDFNKCPYCRCPMQESGRRNGGGEDYQYLSIQEELAQYGDDLPDGALC